MLIDDDEQYSRDLDWYCLDSEERVGHFASAGFKRIPPSVAKSAEDLSFIHEYFCGLPADTNGHELDELLTPERRTERYLHSFVSMANRGLYSFDIETYPEPKSCYFRVALPKHPLHFSDLPAKVRDILRRTVLAGEPLAERSLIPYSTTVTL